MSAGATAEAPQQLPVLHLQPLLHPYCVQGNSGWRCVCPSTATDATSRQLLSCHCKEDGVDVETTDMLRTCPSLTMLSAGNYTICPPYRWIPATSSMRQRQLNL